jgi:ribosomal-protein-alanine N-acetyltransferase
MPVWTIEPVIDERELDDLLEVEVASFSNPWTREMYLWELRNPEVSHLHVLRTDDRLVVGFVGFWIVFDELHLNNLAVRPEYRGRGFGAALLTHVLTEGARLGARQAALEVRRSNEAARRLYERFGFELVGLRPKYYAQPEEDALVLMKRHLFHPEDSRADRA